jgi:hypothetical protein
VTRLGTGTLRGSRGQAAGEARFPSREEGNLDSPDTNSTPTGGESAAGRSLVAVKEGGAIATKRAGAQEVGVLLIVSGIAGILLPGPIGTPLLILGCVMLWPRAFARVDLYFEKRFPKTHHLGAVQSARFLDDLERRYPASRP